MKGFRLLIASTAMTCLTFGPLTALADDELEVTMEVIDDLSDIDDEIVEMRGPSGDEDGLEDELELVADADDDISAEEFADDFDEEIEDGFEHDDGLDEIDDDFEADDDLEEGEDVDEDRFDEPEEDDMDDEMPEEVE